MEQFKTDRSIWDNKVSLICAPFLLDFYEKQFRTVITTSDINKIRLVQVFRHSDDVSKKKSSLLEPLMEKKQCRTNKVSFGQTLFITHITAI